MKYGREYENQADLLGAQIMAGAGYDPRAMARMFETIEKQGGGGGPELLSDHPNPGNRVQAINREAQQLQVRNPRGGNGDIEAVHARLQQMPQAPTSAQVAQQAKQGRQREPVGTSGRDVRVDQPSGEWRTYQPGDFLRISVPANWEQVGSGNTVTFAPDGGYVHAQNGQSAFTHGIEIGVTRGNGSNGNNLQQQTEQLLQGFAQSNPQLRRQGGVRAPASAAVGSDHHADQRVGGHRQNGERGSLDGAAARWERDTPDRRRADRRSAHLSHHVHPHPSERAAHGQPVMKAAAGPRRVSRDKG